GTTISAILDVASGTQLEWRGQILGTVLTSRLMKIGAGTLFLNNTQFNNSFSGGIYLHDGITITGPGPQFGDSLLTQDNGAVLVSNQNGVFNSQVFIGGGGAVRESDAGWTVFRNGPIINAYDNFSGLTAQDDQ